MVDLTKPYEKNFFPHSILEGLSFYYKLLDRVNIRVYLEENFPLKRKDIEITIDFLNSIPKGNEVTRICQSHPELTWAIESIESFSSLDISELSKNEIQITSFLDRLLFSGVNIMIFKAKTDIPNSIKDLSLNEKIKHLIEYKYHCNLNEGSFPGKFINEIVKYCDSLIEKYKDIREAVGDNQTKEIVVEEDEDTEAE